MATWVTHLMIADRVMERLPMLHRRGFCVGNIAPDCNIENEDWTAFTPPREVTHWMSGERKSSADCDRFFEECVEKHREHIATCEELSFLLGYYAHLIADAQYQRFIRDEERVRSVWNRIKQRKDLMQRAEGLPETWDTVKKIISKQERLREIEAMEAEYLKMHPDSGYLTEILPLKEFPDYIDCLPHGCIVRKIGVMGKVPADGKDVEFVCLSREEYDAFVDRTAEMTVKKIRAALNL